MPPAQFVGLDLAWRPGNPSGWAVLEGDRAGVRLVESGTVATDEEILSALDRLDGAVHVAIDAPLVVPNETGTRPGDRALAARFSSARAGPHTANRALLRHAGVIRSESLAAALEARGFAHEDPQQPASSPRRFFEVYPHPAMVSLFDLPERLRYKAKFPRATRLRAFAEMIRHLHGVREPPLDLGAQALRASDHRGRALKAFEDRMDAIVCAYVAARWTLRPAGCEVFGTLRDGYVITPVER